MNTEKIMKELIEKLEAFRDDKMEYEELINYTIIPMVEETFEENK